MKKTEWRHHSEGRTNLRTRIEYGMHKIGEQEPYFSATHETQEVFANGRTRDYSFGASLDTELFPELQRAVRWHLFFYPSGPMHYVANAIYWAEQIAGVSEWPRRDYDPDPTEAFDHTVVFGALEGDARPSLDPFPDDDMGDADPKTYRDHKRAHVRRVVTEWCEARLPKLLDAFRADMERIGVSLEAG